jgi:uncharacterized protein YjbI with pentapeptide repeats
MSFNGSGTFVINSTGQPVVANTVISATVFNALTADLASGLTNCITKDGQSTPTANIPMGSNKITGLANGTLIGDAANLGQVQSTVAKLISITGTDTVLGTMSPTLTAYAAGQLFYFIASGANTGAVTLNIDGLGAKAITRDGSTALAAGDINSGEIVVVIYDGTRFQMINAANSFGNTTINGTLTVTGNTGLQANVSVTSALSVGGTFAVTGAATLGSTLAVTGKSDLPTVSTASANAAVAVITDLSAAGASITSANVGTAVVTTGTVTNLTATSASVASVNAGVALLTTATVTNLTATGASIASANLGNAVISALTLTGVSVASANVGVANITDLRAVGASVTSANLGTAVVTNGTVTNLTATSASVASVNAAVALVTTGTVTNLTSTAASVASANVGTAVITTLTATGASIASANAGNVQATIASVGSANLGTAVITTGTLTNLTATSASVASVNAGVALVTTGTVTNLTSTAASIASANIGVAAIGSLSFTGASIASLNAGVANITDLRVAGASVTSANLGTAVITTGNLTFSSTAQRITGDFSNATIANRLMVQTSTANSTTQLRAIPSGTGTTASFAATNNSDPTNSSSIALTVTSTEGTINSFANGTGTALPMTFYTGGSERVRIDTSGNVGIGTASPAQRLEISQPTGTALRITNSSASGTANNAAYAILNCPQNSLSQFYRTILATSDNGSTYDWGIGNFGTSAKDVLAFYTGGLTERMRIDSSGNVGIGTGSPVSQLHLVSASDSGLTIYKSAVGAGNVRVVSQGGGSALAFGSDQATGTTERMRIDSSGNVLVNRTTTVGNAKFALNGSSTSALDYSIWIGDSGGTRLLGIDNAGGFSTGTAGSSPYNNTTANAANVVVDANGVLQRSTSSLRYKSDVTTATHGLADVLKLRSVTYKGKNDGDRIFGGLIAEEVHDAGLTEFVAYDKEGRPDALHYGNMVALLVKAVQELTARVAELEAK